MQEYVVPDIRQFNSVHNILKTIVQNICYYQVITRNVSLIKDKIR